MLKTEYPIDTSEMTASEVLRCFQFGDEYLSYGDINKPTAIQSFDEAIEILLSQQETVSTALDLAKVHETEYCDYVATRKKFNNLSVRELANYQLNIAEQRIKKQALWAFKDNIRAMLVVLTSLQHHSNKDN